LFGHTHQFDGGVHLGGTLVLGFFPLGCHDSHCLSRHAHRLLPANPLDQRSKPVTHFLRQSPIGIEETSRKGHGYITAVADPAEHDVADVTPGKDSSTVERFARDLMDHNGVPEYVRPVTCFGSIVFCGFGQVVFSGLGVGHADHSRAVPW
jgi:hypothetical protein